MLKVANSVISASQIATPIAFAGDVTLSTGNLVIGTSGKGIDFSATPSTGTSELLADYEEGTFTPTWNGGTVTVNSSVYTKVGRFVHLIIDLTFGASVNAADSQLTIPFACTTAWGAGSVNYTDYGVVLVVNLDGAGNRISFRPALNGGNVSAAGMAGKRVIFDVTYFA